MFYEQDRTQSEIAVRYGISRPMVSKLLKGSQGVGDRDDPHHRRPGQRTAGQISLMEQVGRKFGIYEGSGGAGRTE